MTEKKKTATKDKVPSTDVKKEMEKKKPPEPPKTEQPKGDGKRVIVIDIGENLTLLRNDCASKFEMIGVFQTLLKNLEK